MLDKNFKISIEDAHEMLGHSETPSPAEREMANAFMAVMQNTFESAFEQFRAELDRLSKVLACELGNKAPEGWVWESRGSKGYGWVYKNAAPGKEITILRDSPKGWYVSLGFLYAHLDSQMCVPLHTALEAIEFATARVLGVQ